MKSIILLLLTITTFITIITAAGRCQPLTSWAERLAANEVTVMNGFIQPVCYNALTEAGFTHFWLDDADIIDGNPDGSCAESSQYVFDRHAHSYSNIFIDDWENGPVPSSLCQQMQMVSICLYGFKKCDPSLDTPLTGHVTAKDNRICRWVCQVLSDNPLEGDNDVGVEGVFCNVNDRKYLAQFDIVNSKYRSECGNDEIYSDDENCIAPKALSARSVAPKCEEYTGTKCSAVFPSGSLIYLPSGVEQQQLEESLNFEWLFLSLPPEDKSCAASWERLFCQVTFQECLEHGLKQYPLKTWATELDLSVPGIPSTHALALPPQVAACHDFHEQCYDLPFFQHPYIKEFLAANCEETYDLRKDSCFPTNLPASWAKDYTPTDAFEEQMGDDIYMYMSIDRQPDAISPQQYDFQTQENTTDPNYQRFTTAQIQMINSINQIYHFNRKTYLDVYETISTTLIGPQADESKVKRWALYGETYAASFPNVNPNDVEISNTCPEPLVFPNDPNDITLFNGACAIPCPSPRYTPYNRFTIELVSLIFVCLALIFSLILSLTFVVFRSQRHKRNLFWYTITYFLAALSMFIGLMNRHGAHSAYDSQCATNTHLQHMTGFALLQAMMSVYFFIASSCWWCMQAVELFEKLILGRTYRRGTIEYKRRQLAFHLFCWTIPMICIAGLLCGAELGYDGYLPFSLVGQDNQMTTKSSWPLSWFFFFLPIALCAFIGIVLVSIIFYFLAKYDHTAGLKKFNDGLEKSSSIWFKFQQSLKLFGFVFLMIPFIILFAIHQSYTGANEDNWNKLDTQWGEMVLIVGLKAAGQLGIGMHPARVIITVFGFCTPGLVMFFLWGVFDHHVFGLWCGLLYYNLGLTFFKSWASEDTITGSNSGSSTNSHEGDSRGSTDLFSAGVGLTKKSQKVIENDSNEADIGPDLSAVISSGTTTSGLTKSLSSVVAGKGSVVSAVSPKSTYQSSNLALSDRAAEKAAAQRRSTLFKGFSKSPLSSAKPRSGSISMNCNENDSDFSPRIELCSIIDGNESAVDE